MRRGTPGVVRKRLEISHGINANDCLIRRQCAFRYIAQCRAAMRAA